MAYIDGLVAAVPETNKQKFVENARMWGERFKQYGATGVVDNWGTDVPEGKVTSFPMAVKKEDGEAVVFSWVKWPSKEARDQAWAKMEEDGVFSEANAEMPFDGKRMIFGGFETVMEV